MKKLSNNEMKNIVGGVYAPPDSGSSCSIMCADGTVGTTDCGNGVDCVASPDTDSVFCGTTETCPCDGHDIPNT